MGRRGERCPASRDLELLDVLRKRLAEWDVHAEVREHLLSLVVFRDSRRSACVFISGGGRFYCWDSGRSREHVTNVDRVAVQLAELASSPAGAGPRCPRAIPAPLVTFQRSYAGTKDQVRQVRADLAPIVEGCPRADDFILLASEVSANAIVHTRSGHPGGTFTVRAEVRGGDYAWLEVEDQGGPWSNRDPDDEHGRGLAMVACLAGDGNWAIEGGRTPGTRAVWAWLDWAAPS